jgi:hypothetical protein
VLLTELRGARLQRSLEALLLRNAELRSSTPPLPHTHTDQPRGTRRAYAMPTTCPVPPRRREGLREQRKKSAMQKRVFLKANLLSTRRHTSSP